MSGEDSFKTGALDNALADITNKAANDDPKSKWTEKQPYDYKKFNAKTREERDMLASSGTVGLDWGSEGQKYEWQTEYGEVGPRIPEIEHELFDPDTHTNTGINFSVITSINVTQEGPIKIERIKTFKNIGLHPVMEENVELAGYTTPTPIQAYCIPALLKNYDVVACAQTGSGKTAAFLIPIISKLMGKAKKLCGPRPDITTNDPNNAYVRAEPLVLVVAPTRELATQIFDEARRFCYRSYLRPCVIYGGPPTGFQRNDLMKGCDVLIATPGRLLDFMSKPHILSLNRLKYTVIDEADEMLNMDWEQDLKQIMAGGDNNEDADHVYTMFSATFPKMARGLAREFMSHDHIRIRVGRAGSTHHNITQQIVFVEENLKRKAVFDLLFSKPPARTIIFVNSKRTADQLDDYLFNLDLPTTSIHADRTQREREDSLRNFRTGKTPILIATGVSARGLDIKNVMHIINYDLPSMSYGGIDEYVHRIGRTARIGNEGLATSFYNEKDDDLAESLVKVLLEMKQQVPDFLQQYVPEDANDGGTIDFDDETDNEGENGEENGAGDGEGGVKIDNDAADSAVAAPPRTPSEPDERVAPEDTAW